MSKPVLHIADVLRWADAHYDRTGEWPDKKSGELFDAPSEKWANIDQALRVGHRGFDGGSSLAQLLAKHRDDRYPSAAHLIAELDEIRSAARSTKTFGLDLAADSVRVDRTRPEWLWPLAAVLLVVMVAIVVVLLGRR